MEKTHLLLDDEEILYRPGTRRVLSPPRHYSREPLLPVDKPWEQVGIGYCGVHRDSQTGRYRIWYQAAALKAARESTHRITVCYAESDDGVHWTKPDLGLHAFNDTKETNIVLVGNGGDSVNYGAGVVVDPNDPDPSRLHKLAYWDFAVQPEDRSPGLFVAFSPDGIHWTKHNETPLLRAPCHEREDQPLHDEPGYAGVDHGFNTGISDVVDVAWDPPRERWMLHCKTWLDGPDGRLAWKRAVARSESTDFVNWSKPQLVMAPDENDEVPGAGAGGEGDGVQLHSGPVFYQHGFYCSLLQVLDFSGRGTMPGELAVSRDGVRWNRPFRDRPFLPLGEKGDFNGGCLWTNATPVFLEDETRLYYSGDPGWEVDGHRNGVGFAVMPRDRFAGVQPIARVGQITLRAMDLGRWDTMSLNADAIKGRIRCEMLNVNGYRLRGFTAEDAVPIEGDSLQHRVRWRASTLSDLPPGEPLHLRLHLENAEVFAFSCRRGA